MTIDKRTPPSDLMKFIGRLHPVETELPLIRLGCDADGGYLVPDDLDEISACFSPGVDNRATFEQDLLDRGIRCHLADATVDKNPIDDERCTFRNQFVGVINDETYVTMDRWIAETEPNAGDLLLQMDIEGDEISVLLNVSDANLTRFRVMVIEFHALMQLANRHCLRAHSHVLDRLLQHFHVVHVHPNNYGGQVRVGGIDIPRVIEVTLLRKDRATTITPADRFPHPLDQPNLPSIPDIILPPPWWSAPRGT